MTRDELERIAQVFEPPFREKVRELFASLSDEQRAALDGIFEPGPQRTIALAGTGKTRVALAVMVVWRGAVLQGKVTGNILVPTFTKGASRELVDRMKKTIGGTQWCVIGTFEHLFRQLLREFGGWEGGMWTRQEEVNWLIHHIGRDLCEKLPKQFSYPRLQRDLDRLVDELVRDQPIEEDVACVIAPAWEAMRREADGKGDLLEDGVRHRIALRCEEFAWYLRHNEHWQIAIVLIDEDQDTSKGDAVIFVRLAGEVPVVTLGDQNQSIMGFRGGVGDIEPIFTEAGYTVRKRTLTTNYRSTIALVDGYDSLLRENGVSGPRATHRQGAPAGTPPLLAAFLEESAIAEAVAYVLELVEGGSPQATFEGRYPLLTSEYLSAVNRRLVPLTGGLEADDLLVIVPQNRIGDWLRGALHVRGFEVDFEGQRDSPYGGVLASLAVAWLNPPSDLTADSVFVERTQAVLEGYDLHQGYLARGPMSTILKRVLRPLHERFGLHGPPQPVDPHGSLVALFDEIASESKITATHREALARIEALTSSWLDPAPSTEERLEALTEMLPELASCRVPDEPRDGSAFDHHSLHPTWAGALARLVDDDVPPERAQEALRQWERKWQMADRDNTGAKKRCTEIKTGHRSKGLTRKAIIAVRTDLIGTQRGEVSSNEPDARRESGDSDLALGYVIASRAEFVHIELCLLLPNRFHGASGLAAWEYIGWPNADD